MTRFPLSPNASRLMAACDQIFAAFDSEEDADTRLPTSPALYLFGEMIFQVLRQRDRDGFIVSDEDAMNTFLRFVDYVHDYGLCAGHEAEEKYFDTAADVVEPR